jgi:hypothetical protein
VNTGGLAGLIEALLPEWPALDTSSHSRIHNDVVEFVRTEIVLAPLHVRLGVGIFTGVFFAAAFVLGLGRGFARRPLHWRQGFLEVCGRITPQTRAMIRLFRSLTLLAYFEHPLVLHALGVEDGPDRQARFRALRRDWLASESK